MPWQQLVADVSMEVDERGRLVYGTIVVVVPRQSGKSTWMLAKAAHRCSASGYFGKAITNAGQRAGRQQVVYTAQARNKAREKWDEEFIPALTASPFKFSESKANGNEHVRFPNGSRWGIESTTEKSGHGSTLDEVHVDEAFAHKDGRVEQNLRPTLITRPNTQFFIVSTAGWLDDSPYLLDKVTQGRESAATGGRIAYFEWSAPDDADPEDRDVWRACMPALGHTITEDDIADEFEAMELADFRRAFLNQWVPKPRPEPETVIDLNVWSARGTGGAIEGRMAFALDVNPERTRGSIGVVGKRADDRLQGELIENRDGTGWMVQRMRELDEWHPMGVFIDPTSPAGSLIVPLQEAGVEVTEIGAREVGQACGAFYDDVIEDRFRHMGDPRVLDAIVGTRWQNLSDARRWSRRNSTADISPLYALTLARHGFVAHQPQEVEPWFDLG